MEVYEAIRKRRTIRVFKEPATEDQIKKLLQAAVQAPSSGNRQSWEFILMDDPETIDKLARLKYNMNKDFPPAEGQTKEDVDKAARFQQKAFANSSVIAVCSGKGTVADGWLAVDHILLAATADGLGAGIVALRGDAQAQAEKLLEVPDDLELVCVLKIGVPGEDPKAKKNRPEFSWFHRNTYSKNTI